MENLTVTIKVKNFKLRTVLKLIKLVNLVSPKKARELFDWTLINLDKFYTLKLRRIYNAF